MKYIQLLLLSIIVFSGCDWSSKGHDLSSQRSRKIEESRAENGSLIIIGGSVNDEIWDKLKELMGGPEEQLVVIPTAASSDTYDQKFLDNYRSSFIKKGFKNVSVLHTRDRNEANSDAFIEMLKSASGVWFSGGRQWRHADSYLNTRTHEAFKEVLKRGGVIAGNSAGATIQGSYLARGDTKANTVMMGDHEEGLGFISNVAIDQHLFARNRQFDMFEILDNRPELLGIGIDEKNTAIVVQRDKFRVIGESYVAIYDGTRWSAERDTIYQLPKGSREFYMLKAGDEYDLKKRKVITFDDSSTLRS
jgi:cyanophycinase